ncbi:MAG: hypothetical protein IPG04_08080 [Polyangiaceae bacterium]|jgi:hypothetical protein|nr:hypothetical protein [Polyangiaceae bacterium]
MGASRVQMGRAGAIGRATLGLALAGVVALTASACGSKDAAGSSSAKASAKATSSGAAGTSTQVATISTAPLPAGAKPRVAHAMNAKDACLAPAPPSGQESGLVTADEFLWPNGSTLRLWFMDGTPEQIDTVVSEASEWMKYANLKLVWFTDPNAKPAEVEGIITFNKCADGAVAWYVKGAGPQSLKYAKKGEYNICLSAFAPEWAGGPGGQAHARASVKHEIGHFIGLMHEQFNPDLKVTWDKEYVYDWCQKTQSWNRESCDRQVMATLELVNPNVRWKTTKFDKDSIMFYGIKDPNFTTERVIYPQPLTISEVDKSGVAQLYPGADPSATAIRCPGTDAACGGGATPTTTATDGGYKLDTASKKLSDADGKTTWVVAVGIDQGDLSKVEAVHYQFPPEIAQGLVEGDKTQEGFPAGGKIVVDSSITGFKVRARIDLKDKTTAAADIVLNLTAQAPTPAPDKPKGDELIEGWD